MVKGLAQHCLKLSTNMKYRINILSKVYEELYLEQLLINYLLRIYNTSNESKARQVYVEMIMKTLCVYYFLYIYIVFNNLIVIKHREFERELLTLDSTIS